MAASKKKPEPENKQYIIPAPNMAVMHIPIVGTAPFVSNRFGEEGRQMMLGDMMMTPEEKRRAAVDKKKNRAPKDTQKEYEGSLHTDAENGKYGIPAMGVKAAMARACKPLGIAMTDAKMFIEVVPDGYNSDGDPIFHITKGSPKKIESFVRNANGSPDIRGRAMFAPRWEATVTIRYDQDCIKEEHMVNLLHRAGLQVGIGAGRQFSSNSVGMGWGSFEIKAAKQMKRKPISKAA